MPKRYFLNKSGAQTTRIKGHPGEGHIDIAKEVLADHNIPATSTKDLYSQMFQLKYVRVLEHDDGTVEAEHGPPLSAAQKRVLEEFRRQGRKVVTVKATCRQSEPA